AFGILLVVAVSLFFVNQSPVQLAKNEVPKSEKKKTNSSTKNKNPKEEQTLETSLETKESTNVTERNTSNYGTDEIAPALVSDDIFVKLEQPAEAQMEDFEGYTSGKFAADYS
ncbi:MAG: hypothetical protein ACKPKO_05570, partial [Candidatus Fonsibacter sp.]